MRMARVNSASGGIDIPSGRGAFAPLSGSPGTLLRSRRRAEAQAPRAVSAATAGRPNERRRATVRVRSRIARAGDDHAVALPEGGGLLVHDQQDRHGPQQAQCADPEAHPSPPTAQQEGTSDHEQQPRDRQGRRQALRRGAVDHALESLGEVHHADLPLLSTRPHVGDRATSLRPPSYADADPRTPARRSARIGRVLNWMLLWVGTGIDQSRRGGHSRAVQSTSPFGPMSINHQRASPLFRRISDSFAHNADFHSCRSLRWKFHSLLPATSLRKPAGLARRSSIARATAAISSRSAGRHVLEDRIGTRARRVGRRGRSCPRTCCRRRRRPHRRRRS